MSGFNLTELLPFYLDETDEHIAALNDALLRLEHDPADARSLAEAFRMFHSIKGASVVMGFDSVNRLTHHLESLFEQLRSHKRTLDRPVLDLTFRCLDELRDYHRDLRAEGQSRVDLSGLTAQVTEALKGPIPSATPTPSVPAPPASAPPPAVEPEPAPEPETDAVTEAGPVAEGTPRPAGVGFDAGALVVTVVFEPNLPLADMKARLVLNRLNSRARILESRPAIDQLDEVESLREFSVKLFAECDHDELRALADVAGVAEIRIQSAEPSDTTAVVVPTPVAVDATSPESQPTAEPATAPEPAPETEPEAEPELAPAPAPAPVAVAVVPLVAEAVRPPTLPPLPAVAPAPPAVVPEPAAIVRMPATTPPPAAEPPTPRKPGEAKKAKVAETIRVESDRLDYLMNLAGELVINKARFVDIARGLDELFRGSNAQALAQDTEERLESMARGIDGAAGARNSNGNNPGTVTSVGDGSLDRWAGHVKRLRDNFREIQEELGRLREGRDQLKALAEAIHSLGRVTDGLQKGVLETRMVPIGPLFERFRRVIRDLSLSSGKEVLLQISGEKTELDKRMIDELSDPLIHMVRNSVDHGLEPPDQREAAGKPRAGTVMLQASHRGNSVVITVSDDGRGIDVERIRRKIVAKGLVGQAEADELSDRQLVHYIWHPGLSTAETITEISGRGVGMDIVKNRIENISGTVDVRTTPGQGTTFTIRLPLTLAIMSSLLVRIFDEVYAIPLDHIDEIVEVRPRQVFRVQGRPTIEIRKRIVALVTLADLFRWGDAVRPANPRRHDDGAPFEDDEHPDGIRVVVVQNGETTIGLVVDELIGMQEVVLKSLEKNFRPVPGLSGASILGDGRVSLILDVDALITLAAVARVGPRLTG